MLVRFVQFLVFVFKLPIPSWCGKWFCCIKLNLSLCCTEHQLLYTSDINLMYICWQNHNYILYKSCGHNVTGKVSIVQTKGNDDNQFDITEALKSAKPLRKTTRANLTGDVIPGDHSTDSGPILPGIKQPLQTQSVFYLVFLKPLNLYTLLKYWGMDCLVTKFWTIIAS